MCTILFKNALKTETFLLRSTTYVKYFYGCFSLSKKKKNPENSIYYINNYLSQIITGNCALR